MVSPVSELSSGAPKFFYSGKPGCFCLKITPVQFNAGLLIYGETGRGNHFRSFLLLFLLLTEAIFHSLLNSSLV